ncbi:MAG: DUF86 domain-containing protein [Pseudolysinimonas sp.]|uniref:HepT-like ribonuclease domain-containing protein n=1 Tax=Pseudolysinimonas sp. TaxID=2680009 RepID=UPI003C723C1E
MTQLRLPGYLNHILEAIRRIEGYTSNLERESFRLDLLVQDAVIRNIEVIGEASHRIERRFPEFVEAHPELPVSSAYQMRNAVAHGYFEVDLDVVWATITGDLPGLADLVRRLLAS